MNRPVPIHDSKATDTVWMTLRLVFGLVPIVAGLDKFTNLLVDWSKYLAPFIAQMVPPHGFMMLVGVIEIVAGIGVLFTPWTKVFAWIVGIWLIGIRERCVRPRRDNYREAAAPPQERVDLLEEAEALLLEEDEVERRAEDAAPSRPAAKCGSRRSSLPTISVTRSMCSLLRM